MIYVVRLTIYLGKKRKVFRNTFPIEDNHKNYVLEYKYYYLGIPRYSVKEVLERRITYSVPLKVKFVLHTASSYNPDLENVTIL